MDIEGGIDQFQLLEQKVESLIDLITVLRNEKETLTQKTRFQEEKITDLTEESDSLKRGKDEAMQRIASLLEKIEQIGL